MNAGWPAWQAGRQAGCHGGMGRSRQGVCWGLPLLGPCRCAGWLAQQLLATNLMLTQPLHCRLLSALLPCLPACPAGWLFGGKVATEFNAVNSLELICRAHQLVQVGPGLVSQFCCFALLFSCCHRTNSLELICRAHRCRCVQWCSALLPFTSVSWLLPACGQLFAIWPSGRPTGCLARGLPAAGLTASPLDLPASCSSSLCIALLPPAHCHRPCTALVPHRLYRRRG